MSFADRVRDDATAADDSPHARQASECLRWAAAVVHRWPTWLAIALAAVTVGGSTVESLADVLLILAFFYLTAAVLQRRQATWLVAVATVAAFATLRTRTGSTRWWR